MSPVVLKERELEVSREVSSPLAVRAVEVETFPFFLGRHEAKISSDL